MAGAMKKNAKDHIPFCQDQGIPNLAGTDKPGVSIQHIPEWVMVAGGVVVFADVGLADMDIEDGIYSVLIQNQTDPADEATVATAAKLSQQLTVVGPDNDDLLDIVIVGKLKGQLG